MASRTRMSSRPRGGRVDGQQVGRRVQGGADINVVAHLLRRGQAVAAANAGCVDLACAERVEGRLVFHLAVRDLVQLRLLAPPVLVGHEGGRAGFEVDAFHLERARSPLGVDLLEVGVHEGVGVLDLRRHQGVEETLPPRVRLFEGDHGLLVVITALHGLDQLVAVGGVDLDIRVGAVVELEGVLVGRPVDRGAVVVLGLRVDGVGDHGLAVDDLVLHVRQVRRVRVVRAVAVEQRELRVVLGPQGAGVQVHVRVEHVLLLGDLGDGEGQFAAVLDLVPLHRVVVASGLDLELVAVVGGVVGLGVGGLLVTACGRALGVVVRGAGGENERDGREASESRDAEAFAHVRFLS